MDWVVQAVFTERQPSNYEIETWALEIERANRQPVPRSYVLGEAVMGRYKSAIASTDGTPTAISKLLRTTLPQAGRVLRILYLRGEIQRLSTKPLIYGVPQ